MAMVVIWIFQVLCFGGLFKRFAPLCHTGTQRSAVFGSLQSAVGTMASLSLIMHLQGTYIFGGQ